MPRHLLVAEDLTAQEIDAVFAVTRDLQTKFDQGIREPLMPGRVLALVFEKPSLRTRVSFQTAMVHLGGSSLFLGEDTGFASSRESIDDFGKVLSQYVDGIVCRTKSHDTLEALASASSVPVINGLSDASHPCQALADIYTLKQHAGRVKGLTLAFVGDGNNVARSLAMVSALLGMRFVLAGPEGYHFSPEFLSHVRRTVPGAEVHQTTDPREAVKDAAVVYTDVWASMGQEKEREQRAKVFAAYQVNKKLMTLAPEAIFMHCLPAHRGEEVSSDVIDGPQSVVIQEAANRLHVQKGLIAWLLGHAE